MTVIIDVDYIGAERAGYVLEEMPQHGIERLLRIDNTIPSWSALIPFKLYDDDGELYYEGRLHDDDECINQMAALRFGEMDAGCTTILVKRKGKWVQEIG